MMDDHEGAFEAGIAQIGVEIRNLKGVHEPFIDDCPAGERGDVESGISNSRVGLGSPFPDFSKDVEFSIQFKGIRDGWMR